MVPTYPEARNELVSAANSVDHAHRATRRRTGAAGPAAAFPRRRSGPRGAADWRGGSAQVLETALDVELTEHLGHGRHERSGGGNVRNGGSHKTVRTDVGDVRITHTPRRRP